MRTVHRGLLAITLALAAVFVVGASSAVGDPGADVSVSIAAKHHAFDGETVTATTTVTNVGDATATNVSVFVNLPDNMNFISNTCSWGNCSDTFSLEPGATQTVTTLMTAFACGLPSRKATVQAFLLSAGNDTNSTNNFDEVTITLSKCKL